MTGPGLEQRSTVAMSEFWDRAMRYHQAIREALMKEWDPIGVAHIPEAQDEYDGYVAPSTSC